MSGTIEHDSRRRWKILVLGATGKTGSRIVAGLGRMGLELRPGSRSVEPSFDWERRESWGPCLRGVGAVYLNYAPDLAIPGASDAIRDFVRQARESGVQRLVLLSGRGEEEAQTCERIVQESGIPWTVLRASWFNQNFSEGAFLPMVRAGCITLPAGDTPEPFIDVEDIAAVALAALTEEGHAGELYELTGPRLLTFNDVAQELSRATGRRIRFEQVSPARFGRQVRDAGAPAEVAWLLDYLFTTVLDGRNACLTDGVQRALGRPPKDFAAYAGEAAASGVWQLPAEEGPPGAAREESLRPASSMS